MKLLMASNNLLDIILCRIEMSRIVHHASDGLDWLCYSQASAGRFRAFLPSWTSRADVTFPFAGTALSVLIIPKRGHLPIANG